MKISMENKKVTIVGAGLVGSLLSLYLAQKGYTNQGTGNLFRFPRRNQYEANGFGGKTAKYQNSF